MLCDVGLILFKKPGDIEPILFVPVVDALIIKDPKSIEKPKQFMMKVIFNYRWNRFVIIH